VYSNLAFRNWLIPFHVTVFDSDPAIGVGGDVFFMCNEYDRITLLMEDVEQRHDLFACFAIEISGRFIRKQDRGARDQGAGNCNTLPLTTG
jgi:hypothetical protein